MHTISRATDINSNPYFVGVISIVSEPLVDGGETSLAATQVIPHKVITALIDGVVSEMETHITLQENSRYNNHGGQSRFCPPEDP